MSKIASDFGVFQLDAKLKGISLDHFVCVAGPSAPLLSR